MLFSVNQLKYHYRMYRTACMVCYREYDMYHIVSYHMYLVRYILYNIVWYRMYVPYHVPGPFFS